MCGGEGPGRAWGGDRTWGPCGWWTEGPQEALQAKWLAGAKEPDAVGVQGHQGVLSVGGGIFPSPRNYGGFLRMLAAFLPGPGVKGTSCLCRKQGLFPFLPVATCFGFLSVLSKDVAAV